MARTVSVIQTQVQDTLVANMATIGITIDTTQWSKRNVMRVFCFVFASCAAILEQLMDVLKASIETTVSQSAAASVLWIQSKMFQFQYSATDPQILQLIDIVTQYPIIDKTLQITTACSVTSTINNSVQIKVATGNPFTSFSGPQLAAAQAYINILGTAGIKYVVMSANADQLYVNADVYYNGQYSAIIQANVIAAINTFLQTLPTVTVINNVTITNLDGTLKISDLENAIRSVTGVTDVVLKNVKGRADTVLFANGTDLVLNNTVTARQWKTIAGYIVEETTTGKTFADSLNFLAQ